MNVWAPTSFSISVLLYSRWCRSITEELCSFASGDKLLQESTRATENKLNILSTSLSISHCTRLAKTLLCLVQIVGPPVVNIMAESSSNHGEGLEIRVILLQFTCLLQSKVDNPVLWQTVEEVTEAIYSDERSNVRAAGWTWFVPHWSRASSCDRWCHGIPCGRCTSNVSGSTPPT